jgi:hypothetical protein
MPPQLLVTGIHEESVEPGREALRFAKSRELTPRKQEGVLHRVLGSFDIAQDPIRDGEAQVAVQVDQLRERDIVAALGSFDQPRPHWAVSPSAPLTGRFTHY